MIFEFLFSFFCITETENYVVGDDKSKEECFFIQALQYESLRCIKNSVMPNAGWNRTT